MTIELFQVNQVNELQPLIHQLNSIFRRISALLAKPVAASAVGVAGLSEAQVRSIVRSEMARVEVGDLSSYAFLPGRVGGQTLYGGGSAGERLILGANSAGWTDSIEHLSPSIFSELNEDPNTTTGLTWGWKAGTVRQGSGVTAVAAGTIALTASATNYIEIDPTDGSVSKNTVGFSAWLVPLRQVVTDLTAQTSSVDKRTWIAERGPVRGAFVWTISGTLAVGTNKSHVLRSMVPNGFVIEKAFADVKTAPTGTSIILDININNVSIWNVTQANRLTIAAGATAGSQTLFDTALVASEDLLTLDVDQVGSTVAGSDLTVSLKGRQRR